MDGNQIPAGSQSTPTTPKLTPAGGARGFQPSKTSAFSRPPSRTSLKAQSSSLSLSTHPTPLSPSISTPPATRPRPPSRSSSLQKITQDRASCRTPVVPEEPSQVKIKQPGSPYTPHNLPSDSPSGSAPSPAMSHSSTGSLSAPSSPIQSSTPQQDARVPAVHNLKTFWANVGRAQEGPCPARFLRGGPKKMSTVQKDVLGLLNLSPRHEATGRSPEDPEDPRNPEAKPPPDPPHENSKGGARLPSRNGFMFHPPGHFFPSSKC